MVSIINYGLGNLGSILNMFKKLGIEARLVSRPEEILSSAKLLLPGVGAFDAGMDNLRNSGLIESMNEQVINKKVPLLGICLGMQMLGKGSEEGKSPGLGWIDAFTHKFNFNENEDRLTVPHMGWNFIRIEKQHPIVRDLPVNPRYYFVHSYYVKCQNKEDVLLTSNYGIDFTCGLQHNNIIGVQFHPEKSHKYGFQLLKNFSDI
jgi:imidazole glycerol-phosphate synthase subunit HisH